MRSGLSFLFALLFAFIVFSQPVWAQETAGNASTAETAWIEHHDETPDILLLKVEKAETPEEGWKLHVFRLSEKSRSNREWYEYWKKQGALAKKLIGQYDALLAVGPSPMISDRKKGMEAWVQLTQDKLVNQDAYLRTIDSEKEAYETRLDAALSEKAELGQEDAEDSSESKTAFASEGGADSGPSAYERHKKKLAFLNRQYRMQQSKQREAKNDSEMTTKLIKAKNGQLDAQKADLALVKRELEITKDQVTLLTEDKPWLQIWESIYTQVKGKVQKIGDVAKEQRLAITQLKAEKSYYDALSKIKADRAKAIDRQIDTEKKVLPRAVLISIKDRALSKGLVVIATLLFAWVSMIAVRRGGDKIRQRVSDGDDGSLTDNEQRAETLVRVFSGVIRMAVFIITFLVLLDTFGVNIGPLMGAFAILGLAVSFGSQSLVKDLVTGFFILVENQLSVGDWVELSGAAGTVESISLRRVVLRDIRGTVHSIPNGEISSIANMTHGWARAVVHIGVSYKDDLKKVREVFNEVGKTMYEDPDWRPKLTEAPFLVGVTKLDDSAVVVRVWAKTPTHQQWGVERELNLRLKLACDKNGIEIPYPQRAVTMIKE
jgi:small conductance mechanosensitive channel